MPYSDPKFDEQVKEFIKKNKFSKYLDIGPGAGKYGKMVKELAPSADIAAVEVDSTYIEEYGLGSIYDDIFHMKIEDFVDSQPDYVTDLVIIGDCIEHLKKSSGIDLINYLVYRSRYILTIFPHKYIQYSWQGHSSEAHRSVWSEKDFVDFEIEYYKKDFMRLAIIKGYIGDDEAIINPNATEALASL